MKKLLTTLLVTCATLSHAEDGRFDQVTLQAFADAQQQLKTDIELFCENKKVPNPIGQLIDTANLWFQVSGLQLPATEFMQVEYAYIFWPDSKDRLRKQVQTAFASDVNKVTWNEVTAAAKSLSAIEFALVQDDPRQHCDWMLAIADHQIGQTTQLVNLQEFYDFDLAEQLTALHGSALTLHILLKEMLARPGRVIWQLGPAWRSDGGWAIQYGMVNQVSRLLAEFEPQHKGIADWQQRIADFNLSGSSQPDLETLTALNTTADELASFIEATLAPDLDVFIGFNNFDGD